jgi:hypothetical protein
MKKILLNISCASQSVKIKHIADFSDKPIFTLIISNDDTPINSLKDHHIKVSKEDLNILLDFIVVNKTNKKQTKNKEYPYGAFVVEANMTYNNKKYVLENADKSIDYFKKLIVYLDTNNKEYLSQEFRNILIRL